MQGPIIVFDHIAKQVVTIPAGPATDRKLEELSAAATASTAGGTSHA